MPHPSTYNTPPEKAAVLPTKEQRTNTGLSFQADITPPLPTVELFSNVQSVAVLISAAPEPWMTAQLSLIIQLAICENTTPPAEAAALQLITLS